jgi:GNAT superfamily N-acetyltransferase
MGLIGVLQSLRCFRRRLPWVFGNMNLHIHAITSADASNASSVVRRSITECCLADHQGDASTINSWLANKTPENFEAWLSAQKSIAFGAFLDQTLVGIVLVSGTTVALCYVISEVLHKGVGRALLAQAQSCASSAGVEYLELESTRTAEAFYLRNGFEPSGPLHSLANLKAQPMYKRLMANPLP